MNDCRRSSESVYDISYLQECCTTVRDLENCDIPSDIKLKMKPFFEDFGIHLVSSHSENNVDDVKFVSGKCVGDEFDLANGVAIIDNGNAFLIGPYIVRISKYDIYHGRIYRWVISLSINDECKQIIQKIARMHAAHEDIYHDIGNILQDFRFIINLSSLHIYMKKAVRQYMTFSNLDRMCWSVLKINYEDSITVTSREYIYDLCERCETIQERIIYSTNTYDELLKKVSKLCYFLDIVVEHDEYGDAEIFKVADIDNPKINTLQRCAISNHSIRLHIGFIDFMIRYYNTPIDGTSYICVISVNSDKLWNKFENPYTDCNSYFARSELLTILSIYDMESLVSYLHDMY